MTPPLISDEKVSYYSLLWFVSFQLRGDPPLPIKVVDQLNEEVSRIFSRNMLINRRGCVRLRAAC